LSSLTDDVDDLGLADGAIPVALPSAAGFSGGLTGVAGFCAGFA